MYVFVVPRPILEKHLYLSTFTGAHVDNLKVKKNKLSKHVGCTKDDNLFSDIQESVLNERIKRSIQ